MPITITSTTDTPEDVALAMGAEIDLEEAVVDPETTPETTEEPVVDPAKSAKGKIKTETDDEEETETETEIEEDSDEPEVEPEKPKKITGYKKKAMRLEEENRLLLDLLKKQQTPEEEDETVVEEPVTTAVKTFSGVPRPKFEDFKDQADPYAAFTQASTDWALEEGAARTRAEMSQTAANTEQAVVVDAFKSRLADVRKEGGIYADYDEVFETNKANEEDMPVTPLMQGIIMHSKSKDGTPASVDVMYYLATHPEHCREIAALSPVEQAAEMGVVRSMALAETAKRIAAAGGKGKSKSDLSPKPKTETVVNSDGSKVAVTVSNAPKPKPKTLPPPIKPVGKRSAPAAGDLATIAESGDFKAYEARRKAQGVKYR